MRREKVPGSVSVATDLVGLCAVGKSQGGGGGGRGRRLLSV